MDDDPAAARGILFRPGHFAPNKVVLNVGCGVANSSELLHVFPPPEWREMRLDINPAVGPHIVASMTDLWAFADESVDGVFSSDNIEHLFAHQVKQAFAEFFRVLTAPGLFMVIVPDLRQIAEQILEGKLEETTYVSAAGPIAPIDMIYGSRAAIAEGWELMAHRTGFTAETLHHALQVAGFDPITLHQGYFSLIAMAHKSRPLAPNPTA